MPSRSFVVRKIIQSIGFILVLVGFSQVVLATIYHQNINKIKAFPSQAAIVVQLDPRDNDISPFTAYVATSTSQERINLRNLNSKVYQTLSVGETVTIFRDSESQTQAYVAQSLEYANYSLIYQFELGIGMVLVGLVLLVLSWIFGKIRRNLLNQKNPV